MCKAITIQSARVYLCSCVCVRSSRLRYSRRSHGRRQQLTNPHIHCVICESETLSLRCHLAQDVCLPLVFPLSKKKNVDAREIVLVFAVWKESIFMCQFDECVAVDYSVGFSDLEPSFFSTNSEEGCTLVDRHSRNVRPMKYSIINGTMLRF